MKLDEVLEQKSTRRMRYRLGQWMDVLDWCVEGRWGWCAYWQLLSRQASYTAEGRGLRR